MLTNAQNKTYQVRELIPSDVLEEVRQTIGSMSGIVEVATSCNLACDYCFARRPDVAVMNTGTVERIIRELTATNGRDATTKFIWHGGEPLLVGLDFFRHIVAVQQQLTSDGYKTRNAIQTNGTLLDDQWTDFFVEHSFGVGSSLDGLPDLHDAKRRDSAGKPTYDLVVKNLMRAKSRGLTPGVICVITQDSLPYIEQIYHNIKSLDLPFTMSPVTPVSGYPVDAQPLSPSQYSEALIRLFDVWFDDPAPTVPVNPPHSVLTGVIYGGLPLYCSADDSCLNKFISFLPDGSVYPCNRFAGEDRFLLGNVLNETLSDLLQTSPRMALMERRKDSMEPCAECKSGDMCRGGCAYHAHAFYGDFMKHDYYCQAFFRAFAHYKQRLDVNLASAGIQGGNNNGN